MSSISFYLIGYCIVLLAVSYYLFKFSGYLVKKLEWSKSIGLLLGVIFIALWVCLSYFLFNWLAFSIIGGNTN